MKGTGSVIKEILDNIGDGILFLDRDYKIIFANKAVVQLCRQKEEDIIGRKCYNLFYQSPMPCHKKGISIICPHQEVFKTGGSISTTHIHVMPDGIEKIFDITASPIVNEKGNVIQVIEILRDVTEKKKAEKALQQSEEEFRLLFETALDAIFWADPKAGLIINCNKAAETLLEKKREEIIGYSQTVLHPPQKSKYYSEMFRRHLAEKGAVDDEAEVITKSGKIKPVHITVTVTSVGGRQIIQGVFRDITERKLMEEEVCRYGERLRILHEIDCAILTAQSIEKIVHIALGRILELVPAQRVSLALFDFDADEVTVFAAHTAGKTKLGTGVRFPLEDFGITEELLKGKVHVIEDISSISQLPPVIKKLQAEGLRSYINVPLFFQGELIGSLNLGKDIPGAFASEYVTIASEVADILAVAIRSKQAEEKLKDTNEQLQTLINALPDIVYFKDSQFRHLAVNRAFEEFVGIRQEDALGKTNKELLPPFLFEHCQKADEELLRTGKPLLRVEEKFTDEDGNDIFLETTKIPLYNEQGVPRGLVGVTRDITDRKRMEETLRKRAEQAINHQMALLELAKMDNSNLNTALKRITEVDSKMLGVERLSVWLFNEDRSEIICEDLYKLSRNLHEKGLKLHAKHYPRYFHALKKSRIMAADDTRTDLRTNELTEEYLKPFGITSMMDVPIWLHGEVVGIVCHAHTGQRREWTLEEQEFAASIADIVSLTLEASKRKRVEEMLKESEKKYRNLVDNARVGVYKTNLKGDVVYVNEALANMFEFESSEEMMRHSVSKLYKNPKEREVLIENLKRTRKVSNFEVEVLTKTGITKNILLSATLEGDILSGMIMDVTEQRRAEKAVRESETFLSSIFEGIQDGVVVLDKDFLILFANSSYIEQIGSSSNEIKCKHCYEVSYNRDEPCYLAGLECSVKKVFETGLSSREVRKKDGKYMEIMVYPLKDSSGKVISVVEIRRDVTKNVQLDEEVKKRVRELEEFYNMAVGRELKMIELKKEIERLKEELGKYKT